MRHTPHVTAEPGQGQAGACMAERCMQEHACKPQNSLKVTVRWGQALQAMERAVSCTARCQPAPAPKGVSGTQRQLSHSPVSTFLCSCNKRSIIINKLPASTRTRSTGQIPTHAAGCTDPQQSKLCARSLRPHFTRAPAVRPLWLTNLGNLILRMARKGYA